MIMSGSIFINIKFEKLTVGVNHTMIFAMICRRALLPLRFVLTWQVVFLVIPGHRKYFFPLELFQIFLVWDGSVG